MQGRTLNVYQDVFNKPILDTKLFSTCVDQIHLMFAITQNSSQLALIKPLSCQRGHKMHHNFCWTNPSYAREDTNFVSTCVDQTYPMPASTQNVSQHELNKAIPSHWGHNMYRNICLPNPSDDRDNSKCNKTCWPNSTHASQMLKCSEDTKLVLKKRIPFMQEHKMHLKMWCPKSSQASKVQQNVSQHVLTMTVRSQISSQHVLTKPRGRKCISTY